MIFTSWDISSDTTAPTTSSGDIHSSHEEGGGDARRGHWVDVPEKHFQSFRNCPPAGHLCAGFSLTGFCRSTRSTCKQTVSLGTHPCACFMGWWTLTSFSFQQIRLLIEIFHSQTYGIIVTQVAVKYFHFLLHIDAIDWLFPFDISVSLCLEKAGGGFLRESFCRGPSEMSRLQQILSELCPGSWSVLLVDALWMHPTCAVSRVYCLFTHAFKRVCLNWKLCIFFFT